MNKRYSVRCVSGWLAAVPAACLLMAGGQAFADTDRWVFNNRTAYPNSNFEYKCGSSASWTTYGGIVYEQDHCTGVTSGVQIRGEDNGGTAIEFKVRYGFESFSGGSWSTEPTIPQASGCTGSGSGYTYANIGSGGTSWEDRDGPDHLDVDSGRANAQIHVRTYNVLCGFD